MFLICGIIFIFIGLAFLGTGNVLLGVCFIAVSLAQIAKSIRMTNRIKLYEIYSANLASDPNHSIETLASVQNTSVDTVKRNLQQLINRGYFKDAYIDHQRNRLVFYNEEKLNHTNLDAKAETASTCTKCGAVLPIHAKFCPECGMPAVQFCPKCGASLSSSPNFCPNCGQKL